MRAHAIIDETAFKKNVITAKGNTGASVPFLNDSSCESVIKPCTNGKQRKCCRIPHNSVSSDIVQKLITRGKFNYWLDYVVKICSDQSTAHRSRK